MNTNRSAPRRLRAQAVCFAAVVAVLAVARADERTDVRTYENRLVRIADPKPLLADHPRWVQPVREETHYEAPPLVDDEHADLSVRAWRFSYNARGIIEIPNRLRGDATALVVVHPWGIDDGQGWRTPEPAGCADFCTAAKNHLSHGHIVEVLNPLIQSMREKVAFVMYSEPGGEDPIRKKLYRSLRTRPSAQDRIEGQRELEAKLNGFNYNAGPLPEKITLSGETPVVDYFRQFPGLDAGDHYNNPGFWGLPIPVVKSIEVHPDDVVVYDSDGYPPLCDFLKENKIRHVLLTGYATDMCVKATTAGYVNLRKDFNVFLVGDATLATFPAATGPACATTAAVSFAALDLLITQVSWIEPLGKEDL
jgi:hypothetical protein